MDIQFAGFTDAAGVRQFAFDLIGADRSRSRRIVNADMSLARKYDIRLQELPLLCRQLLDGAQDVDGTQNQGARQPIALTEQHMAAVRAAVTADQEKKRRKAPAVSAATGRAWR